MAEVLEKLKNTHIYSIYEQIDKAYHHIQMSQTEWYTKSQIICPEGCGECCRNFEPDLLESEAIYLAVWLLENQKETAEKVLQGEFPFEQNNGCPFWDETSPYHCTVYGGRAFICRLFGASGFRSKTGETVWKPCKFYPSKKLAQLPVPFSHRQYNTTELLQKVKSVPPVMSDIMQQALEISPEQTETTLLRQILPKTLRNINWLLQLKQQESKNHNDDDNDSNPLAS